MQLEASDVIDVRKGFKKFRRLIFGGKPCNERVLEAADMMAKEAKGLKTDLKRIQRVEDDPFDAILRNLRRTHNA